MKKEALDVQRTLNSVCGEFDKRFFLFVKKCSTVLDSSKGFGWDMDEF